MNGHVEVVGWLARVYFMVYFLVMVIIVSNIVIAFILDTFQALFAVRAGSVRVVVHTSPYNTYILWPLYH